MLKFKNLQRLSSTQILFNCIILKPHQKQFVMNSNSEIKSLLEKFVLNQCTPEEINEVVAYYKKNQLTDDFPTVENIQHLLGEMPKMDKKTADAIFMNILSASKEEEIVIETPERKSNFRKY